MLPTPFSPWECLPQGQELGLSPYPTLSTAPRALWRTNSCSLLKEPKEWTHSCARHKDFQSLSGVKLLCSGEYSYFASSSRMTSSDLLNSFRHLFLYLLSSVSLLSEIFVLYLTEILKEILTSPDQHLLISLLSFPECQSKLQYSSKLLILTELENTRILKQLVQIKNQFPENLYKIGKQEIMTRKNYFCFIERNVWILMQNDYFFSEINEVSIWIFTNLIKHVMICNVLPTLSDTYQVRKHVIIRENF